MTLANLFQSRDLVIRRDAESPAPVFFAPRRDPGGAASLVPVHSIAPNLLPPYSIGLRTPYLAAQSGARPGPNAATQRKAPRNLGLVAG